MRSLEVQSILNSGSSNSLTGLNGPVPRGASRSHNFVDHYSYDAIFGITSSANKGVQDTALRLFTRPILPDSESLYPMKKTLGLNE